ncbi:MAG: hypothetical protein WCR47_08780 [Desulfoplanes sp.]
MKKYLVTLILLCLALLPNNAYAIAKVDENGNVINELIQDGKFTTMSEPDASIENSNSNIATPEEKGNENDKSRSIDGENIEPYYRNNDDEIYTTTSQEDAELYASGEKDDNTLMIVISSILGLSLISIIIYMFIKKNK